MFEHCANFNPLLDASLPFKSTVTHRSASGFVGDFCSQFIEGDMDSLAPLFVHQLSHSASLKPLVQKLATVCLETPIANRELFQYIVHFAIKCSLLLT